MVAGTLRPLVAIGAAALLALAGCGEEAASVGGRLGVAPSSPGAEGRRIDLVVAVKDGPDAAAVTWTLTCNPTGGNHPNKQAACQALLAAGNDPWAPVPAGRACTEQYGDDRSATVAGLWYGTRVDTSFRRTDGCQIARWDSLAPVFEKSVATGSATSSPAGDVTGEVDGPDPAMVEGGGSGDGTAAGPS